MPRTKTINFQAELETTQASIKELEKQLKKETEQKEINRLSEELEDLDTKEALCLVVLEEYPNIEVVIKELTYGEVNDIIDVISNVRVEGRIQKATPKLGQSKILTLQKGIVSAPFKKVGVEDMRNISPVLGEYLYQEISDLGTISPKKKRR